MNLQQQERFYQFMNRIKANERSRAASTTEDVRVTEDVRISEMVNGTLVSKPAKKIEYIGETTRKESEPIVIDLQKSKAGSVPVNKLQEILRFQRSNGRH